jgi:hypothetical protein
MKKPTKPYEKPTVLKLTREQAKLRLIGQTTMGHRGARHLLELMFDNRAPKGYKPEKKSA